MSAKKWTCDFHVNWHLAEHDVKTKHQCFKELINSYSPRLIYKCCISLLQCDFWSRKRDPLTKRDAYQNLSKWTTLHFQFTPCIYFWHTKSSKIHMKFKFQSIHLTKKLVFRAAFYKCNTHVTDIEYSLKSGFLIWLKILVDITVFLTVHFMICSKSRLICIRTYPREGCFIEI